MQHVGVGVQGPGAGRAAEVWGGFAAMLVALPGAVAYGLVIFAPLGPGAAAQGALAGASGAVALGLVAGLLGGTPGLVSAPCGPAAALLAAVVLEWIQSNGVAPAEVPALLAVVILLAGLLQVLFGAVGGGRLIKYIPYPVVAGYLSAAGVLVLLSQLPALVGGHGLAAVLAGPKGWSPTALVIGLATIAGTLLAQRLKSPVPPTIVGLALGGAAFLLLAARTGGLAPAAAAGLVVGPMPSPLPALAAVGGRFQAALALPPAHLWLVFPPALTLAVLLSIDTLKTCVLTDTLTQRRHDSNRELRAQGLGNLAAGLAGGAPGSGVSGATLVNLASGGSTRWSSALAGGFALLALLLLDRAIAWLPVAALAGVLVVVAFRMFDWESLALWLHPATLLDAVVVWGVILTAAASNLMVAAAVGVGLSILLFLRDQVRSSVVARQGLGDQRRSKTRRRTRERAVLAEHGAEVAIFELQGNLFFGTADQLLGELEPHLEVRRIVVLDLRRIRSFDLTAARMLAQAETRLAAHGGRLVFSGEAASPRAHRLDRLLRQVGLLGGNRKVESFDDLDEALAWSEDQLLARYLVDPRPERPLGLSEVDVLKGLPPDALGALEQVVEVRRVAAGQAIFRRGDLGAEIYFLRLGRVRIASPLAGGGTGHLATFCRGDFLGDMAFLDGSPRSADAVAVLDTELFVITRASLESATARDPGVRAGFYEELGRALASRLRATDEEIRALQQG
jgi:SulP family sulfate permease